jgi:hypothetical protein
MRRYIGYAGLDIGISGLVGYDGYHGLVGYDGLVTLIREPSLRAVQIMRQFKPHSGQTLSPAYHRYKGLSRAPQKSGESKEIPNIPGSITNLISRVWGYCGYAGLGFVRK